jgi:hypothetical protein
MAVTFMAILPHLPGTQLTSNWSHNVSNVTVSLASLALPSLVYPRTQRDVITYEVW